MKITILNFNPQTNHQPFYALVLLHFLAQMHKLDSKNKNRKNPKDSKEKNPMIGVVHLKSHPKIYQILQCSAEAKCMASFLIING